MSNKTTEKIKLVKNFIAINTSFLLCCSAFNTTSSLQPIINRQQNMGMISQIIIFGVQILASILASQLVYKKIGFKLGLALGQLFYIAYIVLQMYPKWFTLIPSAFLAGIGNSVCWSIYGVYTTFLCKKYSKTTSSPFYKLQTIFFGIGSSIYFLSFTIGSSVVFYIDRNKNITIHSNLTESTCGSLNCPNTALDLNESNLDDINYIYKLFGTLSIFCLASVILSVLLVDNIREKEDESYVPKGYIAELISLLKMFTNIDIWLLLTPTFFSGFQITFILFELHRAFTVCLHGMDYFGWSYIFFGFFGSVLSIMMAFLIKYVGITTVIVLMLSASFSECIFILTWPPSSSEVHVIYLILFGFALSQSIAQTQIKGFYGINFSHSVAFSVEAIAQGFGLFVGSLMSAYACTNSKVYTYIGLILASLITFLILSVKNSKKKYELD